MMCLWRLTNSRVHLRNNNMQHLHYSIIIICIHSTRCMVCMHVVVVVAQLGTIMSLFSINTMSRYTRRGATLEGRSPFHQKDCIVEDATPSVPPLCSVRIL